MFGANDQAGKVFYQCTAVSDQTELMDLLIRLISKIFETRNSCYHSALGL